MYGLVAALFTKMSSAPKRSMVADTQARPASTSPALAANTSTSPTMSLRASTSASCLRDEIMTFAPAAAKWVAIALPIPRDAPVTNATLPSKRSSISGTLVGDRGAACPRHVAHHSDTTPVKLFDSQLITLGINAITNSRHPANQAENVSADGVVLGGAQRNT